MILAPSTTVDLQGMVTLGSVDANGTVWRIDQDGLTGMGQPTPTIDVQQKPRQDGGWADDSFDGPRYVAVTGTIRANTPEILNDAIDLLKAAVANTGFTMTFTESGRVRTLTARRAGETITQKVTSRFATYSIMVVALDPRFFGPPLAGSTGLPSTSGGLTIPFTLPASIDASVVSGQIALTNPGRVAGKVLARVDGPCHGPVITHRGSGASLVFSSSLVMGDGEWLDIDMDAHTVRAQGQASRSGWITSRGWSTFEPGDNTWAFTAASFDAGAKLTITAYPAA
jgi:hypothetical protein